MRCGGNYSKSLGKSFWAKRKVSAKTWRLEKVLGIGRESLRLIKSNGMPFCSKTGHVFRFFEEKDLRSPPGQPPEYPCYIHCWYLNNSIKGNWRCSPILFWTSKIVRNFFLVLSWKLLFHTLILLGQHRVIQALCPGIALQLFKDTYLVSTQSSFFVGPSVSIL